MVSSIFNWSRIILVGIVLLRLVFVFEIQVVAPGESFSIEFAGGESEGAEKIAEEEIDEYFATDPFHWQSGHSFLLTHFTHLIEGAFAHVSEIVTPPPKA